MKKFILPLLLLVLSLTACGGGGAESGSPQMDYEATKKMVVDILKTDDGKKALKEMMEDEKVKQQLIMDQSVVSETIEKTLVSEKGQKFWKEAFKDPKFSKAVATSMKKEHEELLKNLMKDPEYQKMMMDVMKDPEYEKNITTLLKSKSYREHLQKVMTETFESPIYQAKIEGILLKAANEQEQGGNKKEQENEPPGQGEGEQM
ncbi:spore germination protein D [Bacillus ectoiniformans]|uniref:spore germination lipoprotein GerD n=1 Tax=Bacillus ectoiniformans TaxID=1494429 RepID=UPI00195C9E6C|nr:spore germination lipoprotein GerD [Bacillus ectoiniformans]MBM7650553.1 spore germination protein D [Bacillus ectoiniformans]